MMKMDLQKLRYYTIDRRHFKVLLNAVLLLLLASVPGFAQQIVTWDAKTLPQGYGPSPWAPTSANANLTVGGITRGAGVTMPSVGSIYGWGGANWVGAADQDITFTVTAKTGYEVSLSSFFFEKYKRVSTGPNDLKLQYAIGAGAFVDIVNLPMPNASSSGTALSPVSLAGIADLQHVPAGTVITFRLHPTGATTATGSFYLYNGVLDISGSVDAAGGPSNAITTTPATYGPFCVSPNPSNFNVAFTSTGTFTGNYKVQLSSATGVFPNNTTDDIIGTGTTSPIAAAIPSGKAAGTGYRVRVINDNPVTYGADNGTDIVIKPSIGIGVSIASNVGNSICSGTSVTFSATPNNGGTAPAYEWTKGSTVVGTNSPTYTDNGMLNGDVIKVKMTSNIECPSTNPVTSNSITMAVNAATTPSVNIAANPGSNICDGTPVTFTATPTDGGSAPIYTWKKGTATVGANSATYTDNSPANGDVVTVSMVSNKQCASTAPVTSSPVTMNVSPNLTPAVAVAINPGDTICAGTPVTFTATPTNGGATPAYEWKKGSTVVGANNAVYTDNGLLDGDIITVVLTSSETCLAVDKDTSVPVMMSVKPIVVPGVNITAVPGTVIATGTSVTFTATITNSGTAPTYQWQKNGVDIPGANNDTYTTNTLTNNDSISCVVLHGNPCTANDTARSNGLIIKVTTGIGSLTTSSDNISLYPNPNHGIFTIEGSIAAKDQQAGIEIVNAIGQVVYRSTTPVNNGRLEGTINLPVIPGLYMLSVHTSDNIDIKRFLIAR